MRIHSNLITRGILGLLLTGSIAMAEPAASTSPAAENRGKPAWDGRIAKLEMKDVTLGEVVARLREETGANIIVSPELLEMPVKELNIRNATAHDIFVGLSVTTGSSFSVMTQDNLLFVSLEKPRSTQVTRVFNMRPFVAPRQEDQEKADFKTFMTELQAVFELASKMNEEADANDDDAPLAKLEFHDPTKLLVFTGSPAQAVLLESILAELSPMKSPDVQPRKVVRPRQSPAAPKAE